jgi:phage gp45-like
MSALGSMGNRILGMLGISATTAAADESAGIQKLQVQILGIGNPVELREPIPSVQQFGFASSPVPGASHVVTFLGGDRTKGIAIGSNDPRFRPTGMKSGEAMMYDSLGRQIYLSQPGVVIDANGAPVTINGASAVTINASAEISFTAAGHTLTISSAGVVIDGTTFGTHTHTSETPGTPTSEPIPGS